jgi:hypothetical protein
MHFGASAPLVSHILKLLSFQGSPYFLAVTLPPAQSDSGSPTLRTSRRLPYYSLSLNVISKYVRSVG